MTAPSPAEQATIDRRDFPCPVCGRAVGIWQGRVGYHDLGDGILTCRGSGAMPLLNLSASEAATIDRFEAGPDAEESLRERVARAICETEDGAPWDGWPQGVHDTYRQYADAAIAVLRGADVGTLGGAK